VIVLAPGRLTGAATVAGLSNYQLSRTLISLAFLALALVAYRRRRR
jgi:hypothetical protein